MRAQLTGVEHPTFSDVAAFKATARTISERDRVARERKRAKDEVHGAESLLELMHLC